MILRHGLLEKLIARIELSEQIDGVQIVGTDVFSHATVVVRILWLEVQNGENVGDVESVECLVILRRIDVTEPDVIIDLIGTETVQRYRRC